MMKEFDIVNVLGVFSKTPHNPAFLEFVEFRYFLLFKENYRTYVKYRCAKVRGDGVLLY
jgi:hypothetical protein